MSAAKPEDRRSRASRHRVIPLLALVGSLSASFCLAQATPDTPEFVLLGTTRIGDRVSATLRHRNGERIVVVSEDGEPASIHGFGDTVAMIEPRRVIIQHSAGSPCVAFPALGVDCTAANLTSLALTVRALERVEGGATLQSTQPDLPVIEDIADVPAEPGSFIESIQLKAQQRGVQATVPEGMEMIRTAGGDYQLIPDD